LKRLGIALVQELAGATWTDYNEHDPGVTILEQICYALTDIMYRSEFPVADFLVNEKGVIDWERQSLLPPETAFPCRPMTVFDYRVVILSRVPEVQDVRIEVLNKSDSTPSGLYKIHLMLKQDRGEKKGVKETDHREDEAKAKIREKVRREFSRLRNLCEDVDSDSVEVVPVKDYILRARVNIEEKADPAEILAKIYVACGKKLAAGVEFASFDRELDQGMSPEEMFCGPFTERGFALDREAPPADFSASEVFSLIKNEVPGVEDVEVDDDEKVPQEQGAANAVLRLHLPQEVDEISVKIFSRGRERKVSLHEFRMRYYEELNAANRGPTYDLGSIASILPRPQGRVRNLREYFSVQHHFPAIYGLGSRGVPDSAPPNTKARVLQLKAYLLLFDQHMADYLAMLDSLRHLFSPGIDKQQTYFFQSLAAERRHATGGARKLSEAKDDDRFPGIDLVANRYPEILKQLLSVYRHDDRAKRLVDYLLALYGESFPDDFPRKPEPVRDPEEEASMLDARLAYLRHIKAITRDRAAARDYTLNPGDRANRSGLEAKLSHLLFLEKDYQAGGHGVRVIEHILLRPLTPAKDAGRHTEEDFYSFRISILFPAGLQHCQDQNFRKYAETLVDSSCPAHIYADIHWVSQSDMDRFEELHRSWWKHKTTAPSMSAPPGKAGEAAQESDHAAAKLVDFLKELGKKEQG
jgi:hypothetical protein